MRPRASLVASLLAAAAATCSYDSPLHMVTFDVQGAGPALDPSTGSARTPDAPLTFQTAGCTTTPVQPEVCWTVTLTTAWISMGPVYFYNQVPGVSTETSQGRVVSEVLSVFDVDALNPMPTAVAGGGAGDNEPILSAIVWLTEDQSGAIAAASQPGAAVAYVVGSAVGGVSGNETVSFNGTLALPQPGTTSAYLSYTDHHASEIPATFTPDNGGTLTVRVDPSHWFDFFPFDELTMQTGVSPPYNFSALSPEEQLMIGVEAPAGFVFEWSSSNM